ncbi:Protein TOO MANY MOUTHS [Ananas comosus]|uniref:Protein TOO MANY MOUTHS n=1 Tax=Ananas comosus TaxID=4615 RepID=A0A199W0D1_ANACO|nr:Protein TOO MANY MOUTHS [Ananas comosus]
MPTLLFSLPLLNLLLLLLLSLSPIPVCRSEFTVVLPDSSALVDGPQTGRSDCARTDPDEQRAVYAVMAATGNAWAASIRDVCRGRWHGIECMPDRDGVFHVVSLSFGALSDDTAFPTCDPARSTLPAAVLALPHLRSLFFYRCFAGNPQPIPAFLGRLGGSLRSLVLRENGHVGPIPAELGNLTALRVLDLHGNNLTAPIPSSLQRLARLRLLDLSSNTLRGRIPQLKLPGLNVLDLSRNALRGPIPGSLGRFGSLLKLDLSRNRLTERIPDSLGDLGALILVDLSHNSLAGPLPTALGRLGSLRALILSNNSMASTTIPGDLFSGLRNLIDLILSDMDLEGSIPESIGDLPSLRVLHLNGNKLEGSIPRSFRRLERLSDLRIEGNRLSGAIPFARETMWRMGRKMRVEGNAGLCYDAKNGSFEGIAAVSAMNYCEGEGSESKMDAAWGEREACCAEEGRSLAVRFDLLGA